jgi:hypothetical protein
MAVQQIYVFSAAELLAGVTANPDTVLTIEKKKDDKVFKGTRFLNLFWNIGNKTRREGWFKFENIALTDGMADPTNLQDKRNQYDGTRLQLQTTVSNAGDYGKALLALNPHWRAKIEKMAGEKIINLTGRKIHDLVQLTLSEDNEKNPGKPLEDPIIRFKVDFGTYPATYPHKFLAGQPKTQFFDFDKPYLDQNGQTQYRAATVVDPATGKEVPVNTKNVHLFVTPGSVIMFGRVNASSVPISQSWASLPITINRCVLKQGGPAGFSDEAPVEATNANIAAALAAPVAPANAAIAPTPAPAPANAAATPEPAPANNQAVVEAAPANDMIPADEFTELLNAI